jgi:tRNA(Ile)-lysidine synthase
VPELSAPDDPLKDARPPAPSSARPLEVNEAKGLLLPFIEDRTVLIAVSGGPDSVALMRLCAAATHATTSRRPFVATVDHGLRQGSRAEAMEVGVWARQCGLAHAILPWEGQKPATGVQERARAARYALLVAYARQIGASVLLTAHTLDDQAETILMRLSRGSGLAGLAGMRPLSERDGIAHARPFLGVPKARLVASCVANRWPFFDDPTNADPKFARARWRKLVPLLAKEGLTAARLAKLAERAGTVEEALDANAAQAFARALIDQGGGKVALDVAALMRCEPREIVLRVFERALDRARGASGSTPQIRLQRVEAAVEAVRAAVAQGHAMRRSLAGTVLSYDGERMLTFRREAHRRRGRGGKALPLVAASVDRQHRTTFPRELE